MRFEEAVAVLNLARALAATSEGLTLDEMTEIVFVSRRAVERMRDAVEACFVTLERVPYDHRVRFRICARGLGKLAVVPTTAEIAEMENAARLFDYTQRPDRAGLLRSLSPKIMASLRDPDRRPLDTAS